MPIYNKAGQTVQGIYGGYLQGEVDDRSRRHQEAQIKGIEQSNIAQNAEFLEWLDNRQFRKTAKEAQMTKDTQTIDLAGEEFEAAEAEKKARASKAGDVVETEGERRSTTKKGLVVKEQELSLQEKNIAEETKLVKKRFELTKAQLDESLRGIDKNIKNEYMDNISGAISYIEEAAAAGGDPDEAYAAAYDALINTHPRGVQAGIQAYRKLGIDAVPNPQSIEKMRAIGGVALHNQQTRRTEHLKQAQWETELEIARIKASTSGKPLDLSYKPMTPAQRVALGDRVKGLDESTFNKLTGEYNDETKKWTDGKAALVNSIADISYESVQDQIAGDPVSPQEVSFILADLFKLGGEGRYMEKDPTGIDAFSSKEFLGAKFEPEARLLITMLKDMRDAEISVTGQKPPLTSVWKKNKKSILENLVRMK